MAKLNSSGNLLRTYDVWSVRIWLSASKGDKFNIASQNSDEWQYIIFFWVKSVPGRVSNKITRHNVPIADWDFSKDATQVARQKANKFLLFRPEYCIFAPKHTFSFPS